MWVNFRTGPGNAIFSRDPRSWLKAQGQEYLTEAVRICHTHTGQLCSNVVWPVG